MKQPRLTILLSASVPVPERSDRYLEPYTKIQNAQTQIEDAVLSLARNVFQAGGSLVFGGHPSISPLVAMVAAEFDIPQYAEPSFEGVLPPKVKIYQSLAYEKVIPTANVLLFQAANAKVIWTDAVGGEMFNLQLKDRKQCAKSLELMRLQMLEEPIDAMVCLGGMEGVEDEFDLFQQRLPGKTVYLIPATGGATRLLADRFGNNNHIRIFEVDRQPSVKERKTEKQERLPNQFDIIPFAYMTARIIREIIERKSFQ